MRTVLPLFIRKCGIGAVILLVLFSHIRHGYASDYTSTGFIVRDPVISVEGGYSRSTSFRYFSSSGQPAIGLSNVGAIVDKSGFLYFPHATTPIVTATAGDTQVTLTWTAAVGAHGSVTAYEVGTSTSPGGPYTFEAVGTALSLTKTGLTNGTTYFFVIKVLVGTDMAVQSAQVFSTPAGVVVDDDDDDDGGTTIIVVGGGGGGGGGGGPEKRASALFQGRAQPNATVTLLQDARVIASTVAGADANFQIELDSITNGNYIYSVYSEDDDGIRSGMLSFPVSFTSGSRSTISGIFIAPTISVDKAQVKKGDNIAIFGQSVPSSEITIVVSSPEDFFSKTPTDENGVYLYNFDTSVLEMGKHSAKSKAAAESEISSFGKVAAFEVGDKNVFQSDGLCGRADVNCDGRVDLVDFSITAFWYERQLSADFTTIEGERLNGDGKVDLVDFSIIAFHWTG